MTNQPQDNDWSAAMAQQAAQLLLARRQTRSLGGRLPEACRPRTLMQAWQVQQLVTQAWPDAIAGWKCGLPAPGKLVVGPIFRRDVQSLALDGPAISLNGVAAGASSCRFEQEIGFVLAHDLPPRAEPYAPAEVDAAISHACCALEVVGGRYNAEAAAEAAFPELLADGLFNSGLLLGPKFNDRPWRAFDLAFTVGGQHTSHAARNADGEPRPGLYWLANFLRENGLGLQAGQVVITGSMAGVPTWPAETRIQVQYEAQDAFDFSFTIPQETNT
ncbi:hydratase [Variovorax sp. HJSM1_2]|uniref:hydratase n=1 Tax=Variovorax sp. HJSM1_2 TaxID=3366263 RepID=UPI003BC03D33